MSNSTDMSSATTATELLTQLEAFQQHVDINEIDSITRVKLQAAARKVSVLLEDAVDMTKRIVVQYPAEQMVVRLGADMGIFEILAKSEQPQSLQAITSATKADQTFLHRVLRGLGSFGWIRETDDGMYAANPSAAYLANPDSAKGFGVLQDFQFPIYQALPPKAAAESHQNPQQDATDTAASYAYNVRGQNLFDMLMKRPTVAAHYAGLMSFLGEHGSLLYDVYPVNDNLTKGFDQDISDVMLVDVGGSWGQKSIAIKKKYPELPGRIIVQDLPHIIASAPQSDLCELTAQDFFQPQPVKYPRAFYMRQTLHNHPDSDCIKVISNLKNAMKPGYTKLLVHELVIPESGASNWAVTQDFNMMMLLATLERTEAQWSAIVEQAGLKVTKIWTPQDPVSESVIECEVVS